MKTLCSVFALSCAAFAFAQNVSDYKYIQFPDKFTDFNGNKYNVEKNLKTEIQKKNYILVDRNSLENAVDGCSVLTADLVNKSSLLRNKLDVVLKDCQNREVARYNGMSLEKDFELGYADALSKALVQLPVSQGTATAVLTRKEAPMQNHQVEMAKTSEREKPAPEPIREQPSAATPAGAPETYIVGGQKLNRIVISPSQFILANPNNAVPFGIFRNSGKQGVYHVALENGVHAIGYSEASAIVIEIPQADGSIDTVRLNRGN